MSRASITSNLTVIREVLQSDISGRGMTKKKKKKLDFLREEEQGTHPGMPLDPI